MIKVSVIVPVYNGETYLRECLDSIQNQTLREIEIICVDDGSTDASMEILERYAKADNRFQIFSQEHQYAGTARNLGMSHATGEYLIFWDCDDFFDLQALEKLYQKAVQTNADVVVCGGYQYLSTKQKAYPYNSILNMKRVPDAETFNRFTNLDYYLNFTNAAPWNKLFRQSYIEKMGLQFQNIRNANDVYFIINAIGLADRITTVNEKLVTYRRDQGAGLVNSVSKAPLAPIQAWIDTAENLEKHDGFGEQSFVNKAIGSVVYLLRNLKEWDAFRQAVEALQSYALEKLHIFQREDYYYNPFHEECVRHLYSDTVEQFSVFLMNASYSSMVESDAVRSLSSLDQKSLKKENQELKKANQRLKENNKNLQKEIESLREKNKKQIRRKRKFKKAYADILNSTSYRVGRVITWLPGKIKKFFKA